MFVRRGNALLVLSFIFLSGFQFAKTFNLETRIPVIKTGTLGSHFGYSVAEHQTYYADGTPISWLLVGAPLDQNLQPGTNRSGALWKCPLTTGLDDCTQVITDGRRSIDSNELKPPGEDEIKDGQWLGVSVRSQGGGGKAVVCAHRYIKMNGESQLGQGLCYTLDNELNYDDNWEPCAGRPISKEHQEWGLCQAGTSSSILEDGTMIIGSPGPYIWRGTVFVLDTQEDFIQRDKIPYVGPVLQEISPVDKYSYLGMAVTGGKYFGPHYSYAAGAPRAVGTGQVVIFSKNTRPPANPINVSLIISGEQFASNFGYELTTADLNGDGKPDLIISAPFYFGRDSGGAVYVYINQNNGFDSGFNIKLTGKPESRFGFALANAGDLNKDGCDDLAIGSPYEGSGVVYIYLGNRQNGLDLEPKQVITAEMLPKPLKTFGYSLSGGTDLDDNGYPDLLVGAYEQDSIALLRGRPIIDIKTFVRNNSTLKNIDPSKHGCEKDPESSNTCFSFETCCTIETLVKPSSVENLTLNYVIEAETFAGGKKFSRVYFGGTPGNKTMHIIKRNIRLTNNRVHCQEHTVYVQENARDIQTPIKFHVNYTLVQSEPKWLERGPLPSLEALPVLNATQATRQFEATLLRDCGADDICESDIAIGAALVLPIDTKGEYVLTLGQENEVHLVVTADNTGESAYESQLFVSHHKGLNYVAANVTDKHIICNLFNKTMVVCSLGNPFKKQVPEAHPITLRFDPKPLEDHELSVDFIIWANSTSKDVKPNRKPLKIEALVVKNAELTIKGSARPEQVFYGGAVKGETAMEYLDDIGSRVLHTYQIFNLGPWRVNSVEVIVEWPHQVANNKPLGKWLLYLENEPAVDAIGGGKCHSPIRDINPLGLKVRPGMDEAPLENLRMEPFLITGASERAESQGFSNRSGELRRRRERRDSEMVVKPEAYTDKDGIRHQVVNMNCQQGTAKCIKIRCVIYKLSRNQEATIRIYGRLWNSTLVEDYPRVARVSVGSRATLSLPTHFNIHQNNVEDDTITVETIAYPDLVTVEPSEIPLWVYIVSAVVGLLVLIIVIFVLWKVGFFKRRRPDPTLSGNIEKNHEGSPFLGKAL